MNDDHHDDPSVHRELARRLEYSFVKCRIFQPTYFSSFYFQRFLKQQQNRLDFIGEEGSIDGFDWMKLSPNVYEFVPHLKSCCYIVHFPGNGQNALTNKFVDKSLNDAANATHLFINYPRLSIFAFDESSPYTWINAAFEIVKERLKRFDAEDGQEVNLVLAGWSMGCGITTHVARRLFDEGYAADLVMDRGFYSTVACIQEQIRSSFANKRTATIVTCIVNVTATGFALSIIPSRLTATLGLVLAGLVAGLGHLLARLCSMCHIDQTIDRCVTGFAEAIFFGINIIASFLCLLEVGGLICGFMLGALLGLVLSISQLVGIHPLFFSSEPFLNFLGFLVAVELDSKEQLNHIVNSDVFKTSNKDIVAINTTNDWLVMDDAAVSRALEHIAFGLDSDHSRRIKTVWFDQGNHGDELGSPRLPANPNTTFASLLREVTDKYKIQESPNAVNAGILNLNPIRQITA